MNFFFFFFSFQVDVQEVEASGADSLKGNLETFADVWDQILFYLIYYLYVVRGVFVARTRVLH